MQVVFFHIHVIFQNGTAHAQVGVDVDQVVIGIADFFQPERHDLHQTLRAGTRDGEVVKPAFDFDHREHQFGHQLDAAGFAVNAAQ